MVDNASVDGSIEYVEKNYSWVKVLAMDNNYGFAKANNIGVENAQGEYILFLNNDTAVTPDWTGNLVNVMENDKEIGIAGSKILLYDTPDKINSAGANITFFGGGFDIGFLDNDSEQYNIAGKRGCVCAAAMIVRKEEFLRFGGFDEDHFMYFEDVDLCWKYWLYGKRVEYVPDSVVYHKFGGTSGTYRHAPIRVFYGTRNVLFNIVKNYEVHNMFLALLFTVVYHIAKAVYFIVKFKFRLSFSMLKAYISFLKHIPKTFAKRGVIQHNRKVGDKYLFDNSVIVSFSTTLKEFLRLVRS